MNGVPKNFNAPELHKKIQAKQINREKCLPNASTALVNGVTPAVGSFVETMHRAFLPFCVCPMQKWVQLCTLPTFTTQKRNSQCKMSLEIFVCCLTNNVKRINLSESGV
jgi:hypothetical protein